MGNYKIGYGKPPKHSQFQKGVCPNPHGRGKRRGLEVDEIMNEVLHGVGHDAVRNAALMTAAAALYAVGEAADLRAGAQRAAAALSSGAARAVLETLRQIAPRRVQA